MLNLTSSFQPENVVPAVVQNLTDDASLSAQSLYCFQPLLDGRWDTLVKQHPRSSVFHTSAWLEALHRTYGYESFAYTTCRPTDCLANAVVFCRVESWLTGRRLVSLPFSDHCEPLLDSDLTSGVLAELTASELERNRWRYVELRPLGTVPMEGTFRDSNIVYAFHELDLRPGLDVIFRSFHKSSIQRKIQRAERERLRYSEGSHETLLDDFYGIFEATRRRHRLPPQPRRWFENLIRCFGPALKVRAAYKDQQALAAMITIRHRKTLVYKYGCSDSRFNNLGGMPLLYWRAIQDAKNEGLDSFDLGRTDAYQQGLITFKNRWGAKQSVLTYSRYSPRKNATHFFDLATCNLKARVAKSLMSYMPAKVVSKVGQMLYGHVG